MRVCEELRYDGTFGDDLPIVAECGYLAAGIDRKVLLSAWYAEVNDDGFEFEAKFSEGNLGAVSPGTAVVWKFLALVRRSIEE